MLEANGTVLPNVLGDYNVTYSKTDATGNVATEVIRTVQVVDTTAPVLTFEGNSSIRHRVFQPYVDLGVHATDSFEGTVDVNSTGEVNASKLGIYVLTFSATDSTGQRGDSLCPAGRGVQ